MCEYAGVCVGGARRVEGAEGRGHVVPAWLSGVRRCRLPWCCVTAPCVPLPLSPRCPVILGDPRDPFSLLPHLKNEAVSEMAQTGPQNILGNSSWKKSGIGGHRAAVPEESCCQLMWAPPSPALTGGAVL